MTIHDKAQAGTEFNSRGADIGMSRWQKLTILQFVEWQKRRGWLRQQEQNCV